MVTRLFVIFALVFTSFTAAFSQKIAEFIVAAPDPEKSIQIAHDYDDAVEKRWDFREAKSFVKSGNTITITQEYTNTFGAVKMVMTGTATGEIVDGTWSSTLNGIALSSGKWHYDFSKANTSGLDNRWWNKEKSAVGTFGKQALEIIIVAPASILDGFYNYDQKPAAIGAPAAPAQTGFDLGTPAAPVAKPAPGFNLTAPSPIENLKPFTKALIVFGQVDRDLELTDKAVVKDTLNGFELANTTPKGVATFMFTPKGKDSVVVALTLPTTTGTTTTIVFAGKRALVSNGLTLAVTNNGGTQVTGLKIGYEAVTTPVVKPAATTPAKDSTTTAPKFAVETFFAKINGGSTLLNGNTLKFTVRKNTTPTATTSGVEFDFDLTGGGGGHEVLTVTVNGNQLEIHSAALHQTGTAPIPAAGAKTLKVTWKGGTATSSTYNF